MNRRLGTPAPLKPAGADAITTLHKTIGGSTKYHVGTLAVRTRRRAWESNPACLDCGEHVDDPAQCGLVMTPNGDRVACRDACYVSAILTHIASPHVRHTSGGMQQ